MKKVVWLKKRLKMTERKAKLEWRSKGAKMSLTHGPFNRRFRRPDLEQLHSLQSFDSLASACISDTELRTSRPFCDFFFSRMSGLTYAAGGATAALAVIGLCMLSSLRYLIGNDTDVFRQICYSMAKESTSMYGFPRIHRLGC